MLQSSNRRQPFSTAEQIQDECLGNKYAARQDERNKLQPTQADRVAFNAVLSGETFNERSRVIDASAFFQKAITLGDLEGEQIDLHKLKSCHHQESPEEITQV